MDRALTMAAWLFGLRDPAPAAAQVAAAQPAQLDALAAELDAMAASAAGGSEDALASVGMLRAAWTAAAPGDAAEALRVAADEVVTAVCALGAAAREAAAHIRIAMATGATAVADAEAAAAGWPLLFAGWVLTDEAARRSAVIVAVNSSLDAALAMMSTAASTLLTAVAADPRDPARSLGVSPAAAGPVGSGGAVGPAGSGGPADDGFPARTDRANRSALAADRASGDMYRMSFADAVALSLRQAGAGGVSVQLLVYDPAAFGGQGRVAISIGDLGAADNIAVLTPGISNSPMAMAGTLDAATALQAEATRQDPHARTAVVTWFGYDIPLSWPLDRPGNSEPMIMDTLAVLNADRAAQGGDLLATDLRAFAAMAPASALVTLVGHSMGSATTSEAAGRHAARVDNLVLTGSPGAGSDVAAAAAYRSVTPGHVFVESYDGDPVTRRRVDLGAYALGLATGIPVHFHPFGPDPAAAGFGAQVVDSAGTVVDGGLTGINQHGIMNYFSGTSLMVTAQVVTGHYSRVRIKRGR